MSYNPLKWSLATFFSLFKFSKSLSPFFKLFLFYFEDFGDLNKFTISPVFEKKIKKLRV